MSTNSDTSTRTRHLELLAPAGGEDQLDAAVSFGADAVYLAADRFGMRARAKNFDIEGLARACQKAHESNVKVYVTCNVLIMEDDLSSLPKFLQDIQNAGADALIVGDMGAFMLARQHAPECALHVSTQASVANSAAAMAWYELGAKRIVCAREMSLADISKMRSEIPDDLEIEAFVHGAQCMAISQRCLISSYLTGRSSNQGHCTQPCRWSYTLEEEMRPDVHFPIEEDDGRTFIMNAKDLRMIEHLAELRDAGVDSVKIEGRNKKALYVATVVRAYRSAIDALDDTGLSPELLDALLSELDSVSHRPYSSGFYYGNPEQACDFDGYEQDSIHVADVVKCAKSDGAYNIFLRCRNRFEEGQTLEVLSPGELGSTLQVKGLQWVEELSSADDDPEDLEGAVGHPADVANRSCDIYKVSSPAPIQPGSYLRSRQYRRSARHL